jgi:ribonuclease HII
MLAMKRAVEALCLSLEITEATILVDGNQKIPDLGKNFVQVTLIEGDRRAKPISAASIVAKVERDTFMRELACKFPQYGFEKNKGYGSATHRKAISEFGPTLWHRKDFSGVREHWTRLRQEQCQNPL